MIVCSYAVIFIVDIKQMNFLQMNLQKEIRDKHVLTIERGAYAYLAIVKVLIETK